MRKFLLLCSMALLFWTSHAQTIQLTNGGSTTLSGTTGASPVSAYFEYMRFQVVYTAAELNAAGITGPLSVTQLGWYISTAPAAALPSYTIRMANTTATNSAAHNTAALTQVYTNASYAPVAGGFDMLTLNGSFIWDGTSNLLVDVCYGPAPYVSPYGEVRTYAATTTSGSRRIRCDACGSQCGATTNTTNTFKPQVSLTFAAAPSCLGVGTVSVTPGTTTAALSWGTVAGATGYEWAVTTSATPPASGTAVATNSANATGLTANTAYYAHVRTACSGGTFSSWSTTAFNTLCNATNIPYSENFDGVTAPAIPGCITVQDVNGSNTWGNYSTPTSIVISSPNSLVYTYNTTVPADDWFFTQGLNLTAGVSYRLTFKWKSNPSYPESFEVRYGTAANAASMTLGTLYTNSSAANSTAQTQTIDFTPASSGVYFLGFHCNSLADQDFLAIDDITVDLSPSCPDPSGLTVTPTSSSTANFSWNPVGSATGYEWALTTVATPPASGTAIAASPAGLTGLVAGTQYYAHVRTACSGGVFSSWSTLAFGWLPNDSTCGAVPLTLGGAQVCVNTAAATSVGDPSLPGSCSSPNNTVWYTYTPASNGTVILRTEIPAATGNALNGWVAWYTATGSCPGGLTLTPATGSSCQEFGQTGAGDVDSLASPVLTAGTTYYIMIDGFSGDFGEACFNLLAPPPPPACVTNLSPANAATGVTISPNTPISWNAAATATSYDVYFGTTNPPTTNIGNTTATTVNVTGLAYNTTYYWYVVPSNVGGAATGCATNTTSFTTQAAPANCVPLTSSGCTLSDRLDLFRLKGETTELVINTGTTCAANAYTDTTDHPVVIDLTRGKSYWGQIQAGTTGDYLTLWLDANDNGIYENSERLMNNLPAASATAGNINLFIPLGTTLGNHTLRARLVYYSAPPASPTDPCDNYTYSDTKDFRVNIVAGGASYTVSSYTPTGSCYTGAGAITIDAASNNNGNYVPLVDSTNSVIAQLYPQGNNLGQVDVSYYKHNGAVRQEATGRYYMDRNLTITTSVAPTTPYNLRFFYLNSELNALIAQPGSGVTSQFDLNMTKNSNACLPAINLAGASTGYSPTGFGSISGDRFLDFTNVTGFSSFYLHAGLTALPVSLVNFSGQREGSANTLRWTTANEQDNLGFDIQRSADGINYTSIGFVNTLAPGGNSSSGLSYSFTDNSVQSKRWLYRLRIVNINQSSKLSNVVIINGNKPMTLAITGILPNPASDQINVLVDAPVRDQVQVVILDGYGKRVALKTVLIESGSNTLSMPVSSLASGTYVVKLVCSSNCETAVAKFIKQ